MSVTVTTEEIDITVTTIASGLSVEVAEIEIDAMIEE